MRQDIRIRSKFDSSEPVVPQKALPTMTQQQFKEESDIMTIVNRFRKTGILGDPARVQKAFYGDISSLDYMTMLNFINDSRHVFMGLPSAVRKRFQNDPYQLVRFLENPDNRAEAERLGLLTPKVPAGVTSNPPVLAPNLVEGAKS